MKKVITTILNWVQQELSQTPAIVIFAVCGAVMGLGTVGLHSESLPVSVSGSSILEVTQSKEPTAIHPNQAQKATQFYDLAALDLQRALGEARSLRRQTSDASLESSLNDVIDSLNSIGSKFAEFTTGTPLFGANPQVDSGTASNAISDSNFAISELDRAGGELDNYTGTLDGQNEKILDHLLSSIDDTANDLTDASLQLGAKLA